MSERTAANLGTIRKTAKQSNGLEIAIIGMALRLPGIDSLTEFWKDSLQNPLDLRKSRVSTDGDTKPLLLHHLDILESREAQLDKLWFIDAVQDAIGDAGLASAIGDFGRVEVVLGRRAHSPSRGKDCATATVDTIAALFPELSDTDLEFIRADLHSNHENQQSELPSNPRVAFPGFIGSLRITEPTYTVETDRSPSFLALNFACRSLLERQADLAIAGGVELSDASGDKRSEPSGVGVMVLKRLADAEANGDRIYSVLQGLGRSFGETNRQDARLARSKNFRRSLRRAFRQSRIDPSTIELIEGDTSEVEVRAALGLFDTSLRRRRTWSDVVSHFKDDSISEMVRLIHTSLSIYHRILPASSPKRLSQAIGLGRQDEFQPSTKSHPWIRSDLLSPRRAAVHGLDKKGVSVHAILEEHPESSNGRTSGQMNEWDTESILLDAPDRDSWIELAQALIDWLDSSENLGVSLKDLAFTLNSGRNRLPVRVGMVVSSTIELRDRLGFVISKLRDPDCDAIRDARGTYFWQEAIGRTGRMAFLFPGEGSQYPGMLADLAPYFPGILTAFETSDRIASDQGHTHRPSDEVFLANSSNDQGLFSTVAAVNIVLTAQLALYRLISRLGIKPDAVVGHSSGEFLAMVAAGIFPVDSSLEERLSQLGSIFEALDATGLVPKAKLLAASVEKARIETIIQSLAIQDQVSIAIDNCPHQVIVAGSESAIDQLVGELQSAKVYCEVLPFDRAYHTSRFKTAVGPIREFFRELPMRRPTIPIYSCATSSRMPNDTASIRKLAVDQWTSPVAFRSTVETMYKDGVRLFVEVGVRGNLTGFVDDVLRGKPHLAIASNQPRRSGMTQLNHLVAALHAQGIEVRVDDFYAKRNPRKIDLSQDLPIRALIRPLHDVVPSNSLPSDTILRLRQLIDAKTSTTKLVESDSSSILSDPDSNSDARQQIRIASDAAETQVDQLLEQMANRPPSLNVSQDSTFVAYLKTMNDFLETQKSVVEAYLGGSLTTFEAGRENHVVTPLRGDDLIHDLPTEPLADWKSEDGAYGDTGDRYHSSRTSSAIAPVDSIEAILLGEVSRRTGYPLEILGLDLDMEGDLGIDSIKRVEILGELRDRLGNADEISFDRLSRCNTLGSIVETLSSGRHKIEVNEQPHWLGDVDEWIPGVRFVGRRKLDRANDPIAVEHTLGGRCISAIDPDRLGLPVVPFTVMVELLAQAAIVLDPSMVVVGFREVQANRWIAYEDEPNTLEFQAVRRRAEPNSVDVRIWNRSNGSKSPRNSAIDRPAVEGVVVLEDRRPKRPIPLSYDPGIAGPCRFEANELYDDQWLFHGPALQALKRVGLSSPTAIEGSLEVLPRRRLLPEADWPTLHTDPIILDAFTHLLGCWGLDKQAGEEGDVIFPLRMNRLDLFGDEPGEGSAILCQIQVQEVSRHQIRVNAELVGPDQKTWMRITDWEDWRFYWPDHYRDLCRNPQAVLIGKPLSVDEDADQVSVVWVEPPSDMLKPVWGDVIEWITLSPSERSSSMVEFPKQRDRNRSLLGKIAAKEAARRLWLREGHDPVYPSDLEIRTNGFRSRQVCSLIENHLSASPTVAYASIDGIGLAIASIDPVGDLGIALRRIGDGVELVSASESDWIRREVVTDDERSEWHARFEVAKLVLDRSLEVRRVDWEIGVFILGSSLDSAEFSTSYKISTFRRGDHVWAYTMGERIELS